MLAANSPDSNTQIQRYVRLTHLIPELLDLVDNAVLKEKDKQQMALRPAVELSYLREEEQAALFELIEAEDCTPSHAQAIKMRNFSQAGKLNGDVILSKAAEEPAAETTPDPGTSTEAPKETIEPQETAASSKAAETPQPGKPANRSAEPTEPTTSGQPKAQETQPPATPEPDPTPEPAPEQPPAETQPSVQTEPPAAEEPVEPAFCIDDWIAYAQSYAGSVGLNLDSTATGCWDNPIVAGAHCDYLERDIQSRLNRYAKDGSILDVWIWAESRSDGSYDLYIGYA